MEEEVEETQEEPEESEEVKQIRDLIHVAMGSELKQVGGIMNTIRWNSMMSNTVVTHHVVSCENVGKFRA